MKTGLPTRFAASALALAVVISAPGLPAYAAAEAVHLSVAAPRTPRAVALSLGAAASVLPGLPAVTGLGLTPSLSASPSAVETAAPGSVHAAPMAVEASPAAATAQAETSVAPIRAEVFAALESVGNMDRASASSLRGLGDRLESALTGAAVLSYDDAAAGAADSTMNELSPSGVHLARPAVETVGDGPDAPPPAGGRPSASAPLGPNGPFWPKLLSAGMALLPAYFLAWPLLAAGSPLLGGIVLAGSLSMAVMPFLGESSPKSLKSAPGFALAGLGLAALASGLYWPGAFAAVGGWALIRYGLGLSRVPQYGAVESLSAYFGGVATLTLAALAAVAPAGALAAAIPWVAYPVSTLLWLHLPSWVGYGFGNVLHGALLGARGLLRVMTAVHRDTILLDRLAKFSERYLRQSKWNGVWLALIWTPIVLLEAFKWLLGTALGLYAAAVSGPVNFLWGASHKLFPGSKTTVYFAEAARLVFDNIQNGKVRRFNPVEAKLLPLANSPKLASRALGSLGLTALQFGWALYALAGAPLLSAAGLILAFGRLKAYDAKRHDPSALRVESDDAPGGKPTDPAEPDEPSNPGKSAVVPKLIASALALVPAFYFGVPLATLLSIKTLLFGALALPLAAMPFMGPSTPRSFRSLPGRAMVWNGMFLLLSGHAVIVGLIAALGGWGLGRYVASRDEGQDRGFDDAGELGAFFGALGSTTAVGAAWVGLTLGPWAWATMGLAAITSPFLLMHLPSWVFSGLKGAFRVIPGAMSAWRDGISFWSRDTDFLPNLRRHASYWLEKTYWNGVWLSVLWTPVGILMTAEALLAVALGAITGLLRAPFGYLAGAFQDARPAGKAAVFFREAAGGWLAAAEGSKSSLDRLISPFKSAINESSPVSGRPTIKAVGALALARLAQLLWLAGVVLMNASGAAFAVGVARGLDAARREVVD